ncbi:MAG: hypothetical protein ACM3SY_15845 [Candidatus Omnitrophota bacterium]
MPNFSDFLNKVRLDPNAMKTILSDPAQSASYGLSNDQVASLKRMTPDQIRMIIDGYESRLGSAAVAGTNACPGTNACVGPFTPSLQTIRDISRESFQETMPSTDTQKIR